MNLSWKPIIFVDVSGSLLILVIAFMCVKVCWKWAQRNSKDIFRHYIFMLTIAIAIFAVSRAIGHLVKQLLLYSNMSGLWLQIAPFSGAINTAIFIIIFALGIFFHRIHKVHLEMEKNREKLKHLANIDGLTCLANRRHFDEILDKEWRRLERSKKPLSLIMCDLDYFKLYNDRYGHQSGDSVLTQISVILKGIAERPGDMAARYGGEEFIIILPETDENAWFLGNRLRDEIEALGIEHKGSEAFKVVTVSVGIATVIPNQKSSPDKLIAEADKALYHAKMTGRNKVCV
ncbi:MAG: diguanylate cyclase [Desulfobacterales bacterium]|nr:diguanylate cyclase [Desulfobacterales bacterium]MCP4160310.1 diguanylate cyclase [Deltaproteobacteria bacterium]